jgi:hypothetical protein
MRMVTNGDKDEAQVSRRKSIALELKQIRPGSEYYALTLTAGRRGGISWSAQSHFIGWSKRRDGWEIRKASLVDPEKMAELWKGVGQGWISVHDGQHLAIFIRIGGNALVERFLAERHLPGIIGPSECVHDGDLRYNGAGFIVTDDLSDDAATCRAPTRKLRMRVLKRDNYRCVICGRSPRDNVDIELEVHHVIPWRMGGPTAEEHLATLCGTCHDGLNPDYEPRIRELANLPYPADPLDLDGYEFQEEVDRYRELARKMLEKLVKGIE